MSGKAYTVYIGENAISYTKEMLNPKNRADEIPANETLVSCEFTMELNSAGSCTFVVPYGHPYYNDIFPMKTEVIVVEIDNVVWFGRVISTKVNWTRQKTVKAEGAFAYLNDSVQPYERFFNLTPQEYLSRILANHNAQTPSNRSVSLAEVSPPADGITFTGHFNYESTMDCIQNLLSDYGGYIYVLMGEGGAAQLSWITDRNRPSTQKVEFGTNLLDLVQSRIFSDACTSVIPLGDDVEVVRPCLNEETGEQEYDEETGEALLEIVELPLRLDMVEITGLEPDENGIVPVYYMMPDTPSVSAIAIDGSYAGTFGRIVQTRRFDGIYLLNELRTKAAEWLAKQEPEEIVIDVNAADLRFLDSSFGRFYLGMSVPVDSSPHGVSDALIITKIESDVLKVSKKITVGKLPPPDLSDLAGRQKQTVNSGTQFRKVNSIEELPEDANRTGEVWFIPAE